MKLGDVVTDEYNQVHYQEEEEDDEEEEQEQQDGGADADGEEDGPNAGLTHQQIEEADM